MTTQALQLSADHLSAELANHLREQLPEFGTPQALEKFSGGQSNPTYLCTASDGKYVLRRKPAGVLLKSAHAIEREYQVLKALEDTGVPVPRVYHLCEDESIIGSAFYTMEYSEGRVFWEPTLPALKGSERRDIYLEMNRVLVELHSLDYRHVGLEHFGKPGDYCVRQLKRWLTQYRDAETGAVAGMDVLADWLPANLPDDDGRTSLVHGDFRLDNLIFHPDENRVIAILDWELSTLGHPFVDLAYQCMQWRLPADMEVLRGLGGIDRSALGIPTESEYLASYCRRCDLDEIPHWPFYLVLNFFRLAAICQGIYKRALDGNASGAQALQYEQAAEKIAGEAMRLLDAGV